MRKLLLLVFATAALALPVAASAHDGDHFHHGLFAKLSGTGSSFGASSATASGTIVAGNRLASGTFAATLATDWSQSTTKSGEHGTLACAPASLKLTLTDSASSANTTSSTLTGKSCTFTKSDGTVFRGFFGRGTVTGTGTLSVITGMERAFLTEKADGSVHGAVFAGFSEILGARFTAQKIDAEHQTGTCDGH